MTISLIINNERREVDVDPETPLLWVLRDELHLTGTKFGCGIAQCGACTVHVYGRPMRSCVTPISAVEDAEITTIEGLEGREADAIRSAWAEFDTPQCGYCQSGQIMQAASLLSDIPDPSDADIDGAMNGNLCRCGTYPRIRAAVKTAAAKLQGA